MATDKLPEVPLPEPEESAPSDSDAAGTSGQPETPAAEVAAAHLPSPGSKQKELAEIMRQVRAPYRRRGLIWGVISVVVVILLLAGFYCFWCFSLVTFARQTFMEILNTCDQNMVMKFARGQWEKVEKQKADAEGGNWLLDTKAICAAYQAAGKAIQVAQDTAQEEKKRYATVRARFDELYQEAVEKGLKTHASTVWDRVETLRTDIGDEKESKFSPETASLKLKEAVDILEGSRKSYEDIKVYDEVHSQYTERHKVVNREEWSKIVPDLLASLDNASSRAETMVAQSHWDQAVKAYKEAIDVLQAGNGKVASLRRGAEEAVGKVAAALEAVDSKELETNAKAAWGKVAEGREAVAKGMAQFDYESVVAQAAAVTKLLEETQKKVTEAKSRRDEIVAELDKAYEATVPYRSLLRRNWREEWPATETAYKEVKALARGDDYVELLERAGVVKAMLEKIEKERGTIAAEADKAKTDYDSLLPKADPAGLALNVPELWVRAQARYRNGQSALKQENLKEAIACFSEARDVLTKSLADFEQLKAQALALKEKTHSSYTAFRRGIRTFDADKMTRTDGLLSRGDSSVASGAYRAARELYQEAEKLLPTSRFTVRPDGTVIDYREALMWASDSSGSGCNNGKGLDWNSALEWVRGLRFARYDDWRLPADEQLQVLAELDAETQKTAFPNTRKDCYWSRNPSRDDVNSVFCVNFATKKTLLADRKNLYYVRPVRGAP